MLKYKFFIHVVRDFQEVFNQAVCFNIITFNLLMNWVSLLEWIGEFESGIGRMFFTVHYISWNVYNYYVFYVKGTTDFETKWLPNYSSCINTRWCMQHTPKKGWQRGVFMKTKLSYAVSFFETLAHLYFNKTTKANLLKHWQSFAHDCWTQVAKLATFAVSLVHDQSIWLNFVYWSKLIASHLWYKM